MTKSLGTRTQWVWTNNQIDGVVNYIIYFQIHLVPSEDSKTEYIEYLSTGPNNFYQDIFILLTKPFGKSVELRSMHNAQLYFFPLF